MSGWLIVVDRLSDLPDGVLGHEVVTTRDYLSVRRQKGRHLPKVLNLSRGYAYQTKGYYVSLLAEARGHKVIPAITTILELRRRGGYGHALPELEDALARTLKRLGDPPTASFTLRVHLGIAADPRFQGLALKAFDWFRAPVLEIALQAGERWRVRAVRAVALGDLKPDDRPALAAAIDRYTRLRWKHPKARSSPRFELAVLVDPKEALPPTVAGSLRHFARVAEPLGLGVEPIQKKDYASLAAYDALWIRETTNIDHHTYRFALRAQQEGMPVIDDPVSIVRCTNKVYLADLLAVHGIGAPRTRVVAGTKELDEAASDLGYPLVLKIPDGSFSRGVKKADDRACLHRLARDMLEESDLILAQAFMYTEFDWRVGVLDGEPLFVTQYRMAKRHWQIVRHEEGCRPVEGGFRTVAIRDAPKEVVGSAVAAARLIGKGLYGVDVKQNADGVFVIEVNDNPNLNHGVEDQAEKDEVWRRLAGWFLKRLA
ncbi:MAG: RimK family protein [Geminicoccaceae bacterium]|nr:RimK family protein [Geminicoccaceae bacterium]